MSNSDDALAALEKRLAEAETHTLVREWRQLARDALALLKSRQQPAKASQRCYCGAPVGDDGMYVKQQPESAEPVKRCPCGRPVIQCRDHYPEKCPDKPTAETQKEKGK
jgi:hypothetical protein